MGFRGSSRFRIPDLQSDVGSVLETQELNVKTSLLSRPFSLQRVCRRCYRGTLASIHNVKFNCYIQRLATGINQAQVWIGGFIRGWVSEGPMSRERKLILSVLLKSLV